MFSFFWIVIDLNNEKKYCILKKSLSKKNRRDFNYIY